MTDNTSMPDVHDEPIEGYCMSCRDTVEIEDPQAVWTRKGQAATRGICPVCGGTVFRMGKTHLHDESQRPEPIVIGDGKDKRTRPKLARDTVYVAFAQGDEERAQQIALDLEKSGLATWQHDADDNVNWSGGVHPALKECGNLVLVLSQAALDDAGVEAAWSFFREKRKPIVIAQIEAGVSPPDRIRRSARFDFLNDYKSSLRLMVRTIGEA